MDIMFTENIFCELKIDSELSDKSSSIVAVCDLCNNHYEIPISIEDFKQNMPKFPCSFKLNGQSSPSIQQKSLPITKKAINFLKALYKYILSGGQRTTKKERDRRLSICQSCEYYDGSSCTQCGCPITRYQAYISKLDWKTEKCPKDKW